MDGKSKSALFSVGIPIENIKIILKKGVGNTKNPTPLEQKKRTNKTQQTKSLIVNSYANIFFYIQIPNKYFILHEFF